MSILKTINLVKMYGQEPNIVKALDNVSIEINEGEFVAIIGTSGSGKSTLLNMLGGLDKPTSGETIICNKTISRLNDEERKNEIARLIAGSTITEKTMEHASEIIELAKKVPN